MVRPQDRAPPPQITYQPAHLRDSGSALEQPNLGVVQRMFTMFPAGLPGLALMLLRVSVAGSMIWIELVLPSDLLPGWSFILLGALATALSIGIGTPYVAFAASLVQAFSAFRLHVIEASILAMLLLCSVSLAILGPGAYSLDSRFFGRRRIVFPEDHRGSGDPA